MYFAIRDGVGLKSKVIYDDRKTLIKDLPEGIYRLNHNGEELVSLGPNQIPCFLLDYCTNLETEGFKFKGDSVYDMVSNLEIIVEKE